MTRKLCGATTVFWPEVEGCQAECSLAPHAGTIHKDDVLGEWDADDMHTNVPEEQL